MTIYIQSRGIAPEDDYCWLKIEDTSQVVAIPQILNQLGLVSLVDSQMFSLVLARHQEYFILLVTGLEATPGEVDFMGRKIRNSLVWMSPEEAKIRILTVAALQGKLANPLEDAISREVNPTQSFTVTPQKLHNLIDLVSVESCHNSYSACQLGNNCESLRQQLALEIQANCLPNNHDLLIVITTIKSAQDLEKLKVWRGLSNRIQETKLIATKPPEKKTLFQTAVIATVTIIILTVFLIL